MTMIKSNNPRPASSEPISQSMTTNPSAATQQYENPTPTESPAVRMAKTMEGSPVAPMETPKPSGTAAKRLADLRAEMQAEQDESELAELTAQLAQVKERNRLAKEKADTDLIETVAKNNAEIAQMKANATQAIAQMTVSESGTLTDEDIKNIKDARDQEALARKETFMSSFQVKLVKTREHGAAMLGKLTAELDAPIQRVLQSTPLSLAPAQAPQTQTIEMDSVTIEATIV